MNKIISHFILRPASVFFLLTVLSCSQDNPATVNPPDCSNLITEISILNNDSNYTIPLWQNLILLFSGQKLTEVKTSYDAVYIYLLGKHNFFIGEQELESLWNSQPETIIKSTQWEGYKEKLKRLAENRCRDSTNH
jgi:hypothetical protein